MSFIFCERKDVFFDYESAFCPYRNVCMSRNCFNCRDCEKKREIDDARLENFYAGCL